jgi:transposase-like protein
VTSTTSTYPTPLSTFGRCPLPLRHRVLIALYALELGRQSRAEILAINDVSEADLQEFQADWLRMRRRGRVKA